MFQTFFQEMKYKHKTDAQISDKSRKHAKKLSEKNGIEDFKDLKVLKVLKTLELDYSIRFSSFCLNS